MGVTMVRVWCRSRKPILIHLEYDASQTTLRLSPLPLDDRPLSPDMLIHSLVEPYLSCDLMTTLEEK